MKTYITPTINILYVKVEKSFAASYGFNVPSGGDNGSGWGDGIGYIEATN